MKNKLMFGLWRYMIQVPPFLWQKQVISEQKKYKREHGTLTDECRKIHHFVVRQLPEVGRPLSPESIGSDLGLPVDRVVAALEDLERRMTFLHRDENGDVLWAYPVTAEKTPHTVRFSTGEQIYAA